MKIAILGAGSWGTGLGQVLADNQHQVTLWGKRTVDIVEINQDHRNSSYLPGVQLNPAIQATTDLSACLEGVDLVLFVLPTAAMRSVARQVQAVWDQGQTKVPIVAHASKGIEQGTNLRISQILAEELKVDSYQGIVVLSGPSHAEEVAERKLTTITAASESEDLSVLLQEVFSNAYFRVYSNRDIIGVELGGALKNVYAVMAGGLEELSLGDNAKAALMTRGLAEMSRLGVVMGADPLTFAGLSGLGDLIVTCTSVHSRNFQAGRLLAQGKSRQEADEAISMVVEGMYTVQAVHDLSQELGVEMPLANGLYDLLYGDLEINEAIKQWMTRASKQEASLNDHYDF